MSFGELIALVLAFGGTLASILGFFYTIASRRNGRETRELIKTIHEETRALIDRIDQRADEGHREVIEAIRVLRSA